LIYTICRTTSFKKAFKKLSKIEQNLTLDIIVILANAKNLEKKYKDHALVGNYKNCRECHIKPDMLLIYKIERRDLELLLVEVGTHSELFD
jgi:mRNA interferase YafQ